MSNLAKKVMATPESAQSAKSEFPISENNIDVIEAILQQESGVRLGVSRDTMVYSRLVKRLRKLHLENFNDYCRLIEDRSNVEERKFMVDALTTNHTHFFREEHHFDHMKAQSLPALLAAAKNGARIRLWCAGCSSGEEPYCMAITILSLLPNAGSYDIKILATDIDRKILEKARTGIYPERGTTKIPQEIRDRWFEKVQSGLDVSYKVVAEVRNLVSFRELNLITDWPMKGPFQIVFCRNVVIYFDDEIKSRLWQKFSEMVAPQGTLYIGHSEHVSGPATKVFKTIATTTYERNGETCL